MAKNPSRNFNCKIEELPVVCRFNLSNLKRDLNDFIRYSPIFGDSFVTNYEEQIDNVAELILPKTEIAAQKVITERLHGTISSLIVPVTHLKGYITMCKGISISPKSYGLSALLKSIRAIDPEGVMQNLNVVFSNNNKYAEMLAEKGFKPELAACFTNAAASIAADKQAQYEIISNRKLIVQNNTSTFNALNETLTQVLSIGRIIYANTDPVKAKEYSFTQLKKQVRRASKPNKVTTDNKNIVPASKPE